MNNPSSSYPISPGRVSTPSHTHPIFLYFSETPRVLKVELELDNRRCRVDFSTFNSIWQAACACFFLLSKVWLKRRREPLSAAFHLFIALALISYIFLVRRYFPPRLPLLFFPRKSGSPFRHPNLDCFFVLIECFVVGFCVLSYVGFLHPEISWE